MTNETLTRLKLRDFRCFDALECEFSPSMNVFVGANAQGKTSLLEAVCVLLRLQSPRLASLARAIRHEKKSFVLDGYFGQRHLQFYFSGQRKKLALDSVEQSSALQYLEMARVVWFSNQDLDLVCGAADRRRRFLDFVAAQIDPGYRRQLRSYEKALRSRNYLLKAAHPGWREIAAFDSPLVEAGNSIAAARCALIGKLDPIADEAQRAISDSAEVLKMDYVRGAPEDFATALEASRGEDLRLRQTVVGPHRDDLALALNGHGPEFASEGQQRSIALAMKLAQARLLEGENKSSPILLLDDIFGELDVNRRNALLRHLPSHSQRLVTTTHIDWLDSTQDARILSIAGGKLTG